MIRLRRTNLVVVAIAATAGASHVASAQTTAPTTTVPTGGPTVTNAINQIWPNRIVNSQDLGQSTRPVQLTPTGISYSDCASDMILKFPLLITGFSGQVLEVWAGTTDCSMQGNRGIGGGFPTCWEVTPPIAGLVAGTASPVAETVSVRVQDLVGHASSVPQTPTYVPVGAAACTSQTVDTGQMITVYFVPTTANGYDVSNSVSYPRGFLVDLVAPPPPVTGTTTAGVGDTFLQATWTPEVDPDTIGYDVYVDPIPGMESAPSVGSETVLVCPDTGAATPVDDATTGLDAADDASDDAGSVLTDAETDGPLASSDASDASQAADASDAALASRSAGRDAECTLENISPNDTVGTNGICASSALTMNTGVVLDASTSASTIIDAQVAAVDDADTDAATSTTADDAAVPSTGGGISNVNPKYLYQPDSVTGITVASQTASSFNITGLIDGKPYNIAIASVDALGNVGPLSPLECGTPELVKDFWKTYREDGGQAGGGFCALDAPGMPTGSSVMLAGVVAAVGARLRRRRRGAK